MTPDIYFTIYGIRAPYPIPEDQRNGCNDLVGTMCPITEGEFVTFGIGMAVEPNYPLVKIEVEFRLFDGSNNALFCVAIDVEIVEA